MKKTSTYLSRHTSGIIAALAMLAYAFSASAEEYKSMIRYDRVWECFCDYSGNESFKCMRFDGTEEIFGKTWHRLVTFKETKLIYHPLTQDYTYVGMDDVIYKHEGYMREENGVVYTLVNEDISELGDLYVPSAGLSVSEPEDVAECVLYDFNRAVDDCYDAVTFIGPFKCGMHVTFKVLSKNTMEIGGEECISMEVACIGTGIYGEKYLFSPHTVVEGIGAGDSGCLNYHEFQDKPTMEWSHNIFSRVFDMQANAIFGKSDGFKEGLQYSAFSDILDVEKLETCDRHDTPLYDILGRRITDPIPGQLYIRNGKKHVAK